MKSSNHRIDRREFVKYAAGSAMSLPFARSGVIPFAGATAENPRDATGPRPTAAQIAWQDFEVGMLFSLDLPVFAPGGWTDKLRTYNPNLYDPVELDTDQWLESAKLAGVRYAVFTATHFNGFLQWQSDLYPYGLKLTSWRRGKADVVKMFVESCHKYNIAPGLFLSCHENAYMGVKDYRVNWGKGGPGQAAFAELGARMTEELCSRYGPLCEIWYDAGLLSPKDGGPNVIPVVEKYQKNIVFYSSPQRADHRWIGNEAGIAGEPCWATMPSLAITHRAHFDANLSAMRALDSHGDPSGKLWSPAMADIPIRNHDWFWRPGEAYKLYTPDELVKIYYTSVGRNSNMVIGAVPDTRGLIPDKDFAVAAAFGKEIRRRFEKPLARTKGDGDEVVLVLPQSMRVNHITVMEDIFYGERIRNFTLDLLTPQNKWESVFKGESVGHKRIVRFAAKEASRVRIRVQRRIAEPRIRELSAYFID